MADGQCVRCHLRTFIVARGMCHHCYHYTRTHGSIDHYPTISQRGIHPPLVCRCASPLVEPLIVWGSYQCERCGRLITPERMDELTHDAGK